jgi:hypothetical protein
MKKCSSCGVEKPISEFYKHEGNLDGLRNQCINCRNFMVQSWVENHRRQSNKIKRRWVRKHHKKKLEVGRRWKRNNPAKEKNTHLMLKYDITFEIYCSLLEFQKYRCAICGSKTTNAKTKKYLSVDHNHKENIVRGLLCFNCNLLVGFAKDNPQILKAALNYLKAPPFNKFLNERKV